MKTYDDPQDDISISAQPAALVLNNPVIDNGPTGLGYDWIKDQYKQFSPMHNIAGDAPPMLFLLGGDDKLIPVATAEKFKEVDGGSWR